MATTSNDKPVELELVACDICLKEVPISEATVPEATDYVVHFCGIECYQKWKQQGEPADGSGQAPGA